MSGKAVFGMPVIPVNVLGMEGQQEVGLVADLRKIWYDCSVKTCAEALYHLEKMETLIALVRLHMNQTNKRNGRGAEKGQGGLLDRSVFLCALTLCALWSSGLLVGCTSPYQEVRRKDTISAYEQFLKQNPNSEHRDEASRRLEKLVYEKAVEQHSVESYGSYLRRYPRGRYRGRARRQMESLAFQDARSRGSMKAYQAFLRRFPGGTYANDAKDRIEALFFQKALRYRSYVGMQAYIRHFPRGRFRIQAEDKVREYWWSKILQAPTIPKIERWLRRYPSGRLTAQARARLSKLRYRKYEESGKWWLLQKWLNEHPTSALRPRAEKHIKVFRKVFPQLQKARQHAEAGEKDKALRLYKRLYRRYRRDAIASKLVAKDVRRFNFEAQIIK